MTTEITAGQPSEGRSEPGGPIATLRALLARLHFGAFVLASA
jgi:hypothetical protein